MAISTERIVGRQLTVTCAGSVTKWKEITGTITESTDDAQGSDEYEEGVVRTGGHFEAKITGFLGAVNNGATLPMPGDVVSDLSIAVGADSVLPSLSQFTNFKVVGPVTYNLVKGAGTFEFNIRSSVLN